MRILISLVALLFLLPSGLATAQSAAVPTLRGTVETPLTLDSKTLKALPATSIDVSFKTGKGVEIGHYTGALLWSLIKQAGLVNEPGKNAELRHTVLVTGRDGYAVVLAVGELDPDFAGKTVLVAYQGSAPDDASFDHLRLIVPGDLHGGRSVKDIASIEVK
jgi:hypothetical protein